MVSGYFQSTIKFKMSKLIKNINLCWFYRILILTLLTIFRIWQPTSLDIFQQTFIIDLGVYWFMDIFIFLYCLSPFLNILISKLSKKDSQKFLLVLFLLFSVIPYLTGHKAFANNGYTLYNFIFVYFLGAYLHKYPFTKESKIKNLTLRKKRLLYFSLFFILGIFHYLLTKTASHMPTTNLLSAELSANILVSSLSYSNPIVILQTIFYFLFFETLSFQNKFINRISALTIGVYLIHDHPAIRGNLYHWLKIDDRIIYSFRFIFYILICVLLIFVLCAIIEWIRQVLFKFISNLKISKWWQKTYRKKIDKLGLEINW